MKKFLVFLVSLVVVVCLGMTFYYFAKDEEAISINTSTIYINSGETISLEELGFSHKNPKKSTKIDFNAGGETCTNLIRFDESLNRYVPTDVGGSTTIVITSNNKRYARFEIKVNIGVGSEDYPFYVNSEEDLFNIGSQNYPLTSNYKLTSNIDINETHYPIGYQDGTYYNFNGTFDGSYYTISNLKVSEGNYGGLFASVGPNGKIKNVKFENATFSGAFKYLGTVAGLSNGYIDQIEIINSDIQNTSSTSSYTGSVVGLLQTSEEYINNNNTTASINRVDIVNSKPDYSLSGKGYVGGVAGQNICGLIQACKVEGNIVGTSTSSVDYIGGIVGDLSSYKEYGAVWQSYSLASISKNNSSSIAGGVLGSYSAYKSSSDVVNAKTIVGNYFNKEVSNLNAIGKDNLANTISYSANGKTEEELKLASNYIYYTTPQSITYWSEECWYRMDGQYPILLFTTKAIPGVDINTNNPIPTPDIDDDDDNTETVVVSTENGLDKYISGNVLASKNYILRCNVVLKNNTAWTPIKFSNGSLRSEGNNLYSISTFVIESSKEELGIFSQLSNVKITNIKIDSVNITSQNSKANIGGLASVIKNNCRISGVVIDSVNIQGEGVYAGGIVGGTDTTNNKIIASTVNNSQINGEINNMAGVVGFLDKNSVIEDCTATSNLTGLYRAGGLVAVNNGTIKNSTADTQITNNLQDNKIAYFGGLVAVNKGYILNSQCNGIDANLNNASKKYQVIIGGIAGLNDVYIEKCTVSGNIKVNAGSSNVYIGGIIGANNGQLTASKCTIAQLGSIRDDIYSAGIVCTNSGVINTSISTSEIYGNFASGIVCQNIDGIINECQFGESYNSKSTVNGNNISGVCFNAVSGNISNTLIYARLNGKSSNGTISGIACYLPYNSGNFCTISNSIIAVDFAGEGTRYLETANTLLLSAKEKSSGRIVNCIFDNANIENVNVATKSSLSIFWIKIKTYESASKSSYMLTDYNGISNIDNYISLEFDISFASNSSKTVWKISNGVPYLANI